MSIRLLALAVALGSTACGLWSPSEERQVAAVLDRASFVPAEAYAYVEASSWNELEATARDVTRAFDVEVDLESELAGLGLVGELAHVDRARPLGVAFTALGGQEEPARTWLVPVVDAGAFLDSLPAGTLAPHVGGGYVALASHELRGTRNVLGRGLPDGVLRARLDCARMPRNPAEGSGRRSAPILTAAEEALSTSSVLAQSLLGMLFTYGSEAAQVLESADAVDLAVRISGAELLVEATFTAREGTELATISGEAPTRAAELARRLDPDAPTAWATGVDGDAMWAQVRNSLDSFSTEGLFQTPPRFHEGLTEAATQLFEGKGDYAATYRIDSGGLAFTVYVFEDDLASVRASLDSAFSVGDELTHGIALAEPVRREVAGVEVFEYGVEIDFEALSSTEGREDLFDEHMTNLLTSLYGPTGPRIALAGRGGVAMVAYGGDEGQLTRAVAGLREQPARQEVAFDRAVAAVEEANPAMVMRYDLLESARQMERLMPHLLRGRSVPQDAAPAPVSYYCGAVGPRWRIGATCNLDQVGAGVRLLDPTTEESK